MSSLESGLRILTLIDARRPTLRLTDVIQRLSMSKSTAARLLHSMVHAGMLERVDEDDLIFRPGPRAMALGQTYSEVNPAAPLLREAVLRLGTDSNFTSYAITLSKDWAVTLDIDRNNDFNRLGSYAGQRRRPWASASGQALLAQLPEEDAYCLLQEEDAPDWKSFRRNLGQIRRQGFLEMDCQSPGFKSLAIVTDDVPCFGRFALCLVWPEHLVGREKRHELFDTLFAHGDALGRRMLSASYSQQTIKVLG